MEEVKEYIKIIIKEKLEIRKSYEQIIEKDRQLVVILTLLLELAPKH